MKQTFVLMGLMAVSIIILLPDSGLAFPGPSGNTFISGYYGNGFRNSEDPYTNGELDIPSKNPEISALHCDRSEQESYDYVAIVFTCNVGNVMQVRLALSEDNGNSWSFEWIYANTNFDQDMADVKIYYDEVLDEPVLVVVWQQMPVDDSEEYEIKAREKRLYTDVWIPSAPTYIYDVSDTAYGWNDNNCINPKVSACSSQSTSYWNVVWQSEWDGLQSNRYGILLRRFVRDQSLEGFLNLPAETIDAPLSNDYNHREPATDCLINEATLDIYIVYHYYNSSANPNTEIKFVIGSPGNPRDPAFSSPNPQSLEEMNGDTTLGYPDVTVIGQTDGEGHTGNTIDCVWSANIDNNEQPRYCRSYNGGVSFSTPICPDPQTDGYCSIRSVAVDSYMIDSDTYSATVIWTTSTNVYYRIRDNDDANFGSKLDGAITGYSELFVDIALFADSSAQYNTDIYSHGTYHVTATAVFYGRHPN